MAAAKAFLDANIFVYAQDKDAPAKRRRSRELISRLADAGSGVISTQVMQEFFVASTRKLRVDPLAAKGVVRTLSVFEIVQTTPELVERAIDVAILDRLSFWDALIVVAAAASGCAELYSEDLNAGRVIHGVRVVNPFA